MKAFLLNSDLRLLRNTGTISTFMRLFNCTVGQIYNDGICIFSIHIGSANANA